ncbi:MAG: ABC transporter substrate-binding protein [Gammaproteobacteria bacterium]|nr:ABC transporter substrate-binding protein [Gammaproteobacteria bacterium]
MKRHLSLLFVLLLTMTSSVQAFNGYYAPPKQTIESPLQTIQSALEKLQAFSTNKKNTNPELLRGFIENEIIPHFAFDQMTYWIAGPYARRMNAENMKELENSVKKTFLNSLSTHLGNYNASSIRANLKRAQYRGRDEANVSMMLIGTKQMPDRLDFRMKLQGKNWKIIDITANGLSAAMYYRQYFMSTLQQYR